MKTTRVMRQLFKNCDHCHRKQSIIWTKCPHCLYVQLQSYESLFKKIKHNQQLKKSLSGQEQKDNKIENEYEDVHQEEEEDITEKTLQKQPQGRSLSSLKKNSRNQRLVQNNVNIDNTQNQVNYKIDGSIGKYIIMFIIFLCFIGLLIWDLSVLRSQELSKIMNKINECELNYNVHECDRFIMNMGISQEWKKLCYEYKICKDQDPYQNIKLLELLTLYFAEITNSTINTLGSKVVGIVLVIYFFGLAFQQFLSCICPRRS